MKVVIKLDTSKRWNNKVAAFKTKIIKIHK